MKKRTTLFHSFISLLLCVSMLVGTTFAWFTDSVVTGINTIAAGTLDVELYHSNAAATDERVDSATKLFMDLQGNPILWEPGAVSYENLRVANEGDLALAYQLAMRTANENHVVDSSGAQYGLSQILKVGVVENGITATDRAGVVASVNAANWTTLAEFLQGGSLLPEGKGEFEKTWGIVIYWEPGENDNYWNLNNDKVLDQGEYLMIDLGISLIATQEEYESDSFGSDYDAEAKAFLFPDYVGGSASAPVVPDAENKTSAQVSMSDGHVSAVVPAGVLLETGVTELKLTVTPMNASGANIALGENEDLRALDVHVEGVSADNTVPMIIDLGQVMPVGLNMGNYKLYHVEDGANNAMTLVASEADFNAHNQFTYDPATGAVKLYMASFSTVAVVADTTAAWEGKVATAFAGGTGTETDPYIIANADQLAYLNDLVSNGEDVSKDKHYKLIADINFGGSSNGHIWYPIGYWAEGEGTNKAGEETWYTCGDAFQGVFDGAGHKISGIYQNTWAMDGNYDNGYWKEAMGLFGYVNGGTVKNLTVDNFKSEGEFAVTGCVAAYAANATFENIAITNSHPATYNTSVAAVVGRDGKNGENNNDGYNLIFKNITVDSTNIISALWGSWDVGAAGLLGYLGSDSKVLFENCNVAATIDVYNDVCGNYQYYWYRYCGAYIGTVDKRLDNGQGALDLSNVTAENCTVDFGDRHEYYYCEFVENTKASYTHDYQMSRVDLKDIVGRGDSATCRDHNHEEHGYETINGVSVLVEDKQAVYIPFRQLFGGYGWGVDGVDEYENIDITTIANEDKFEKNEALSGDFLYRVGNKNAFPVGKLFQEIAGKTAVDSGVYVSVESLLEGVTLTGTFVKNDKDWTQSTLHITGGTGLAKLTIQDYNNCTPFELIVEVVDAVNATTATNATANNVVLLDNISTTSLDVSNGYSLYGNGFKITCNHDGAYSSSKSLAYGYITVSKGGVLDNAQVICNVYPESYLFTSEMKAVDGKYPYGYSAVLVSGNSTISNCYIYGARNNILVTGGNVKIEDTITVSGSFSNIHINGADSDTVTLHDVTTVQYETTSAYDTTKKVLGFAVVVGTNESASNAKLVLMGDLKQYNWVTSDNLDISNSYAKTALDSALKVTEYQHLVNGKNSVNLGIAYLNTKTASIDEHGRTNKNTVPYKSNNITMTIQGVSATGQVFSVYNGGDTSKTVSSCYDPEADGIISADGSISYIPSANRGIAPEIVYNSTNSSVALEKYFDSVSQKWVNKVTADLDTIDGGSFDFYFNGIKVQKYGQDLTFAVKDANGNTVDANAAITLNALGSSEYSISVTYDGVEYTLPFVLAANRTSIPKPAITYDTSSFTSTENGRLRLADTKSGDWRPTVNALAGVKITYWSTAENKEVVLDLGNLDLDSNNGTVNSNVWTYTSNDFTLSLTGGEIKTGYNITPIVSKAVDNTMKLYFCSTNVAYGTTSTNDNRTIKIDYVLTANGETATLNRNETVNFTNLTVYEYDAFKSGSLKPAEDGCVTAGTMMTMADGTQKRVEDLKIGDMLMAFNHITGKLEAAPLIFNTHAGDEKDYYDVLNLQFSNGTEVEIVESHGFFDVTLMKYVYIDYENYKEFIGHKFYSDGNAVKLTKAFIEEEYTAIYCPVTYFHMNSFANGMLNTPNIPGGITGLVNYFEYDADLKYNEAAMQRDIEKYGLYTYEDFSDYISEAAYNSSPAVYLKVAVGKGMITFEEILDVIDYLLAGSLIS